MILVCHVIFQDHIIKVLSYDLAKLSGHRHSGSGHMFLVCHVISQDHKVKV